MDLNKKGALIKFKEIESAAKAAASTDVILDNPKIKVIYTIIGESNTNNNQNNDETASPKKD